MHAITQRTLVGLTALTLLAGCGSGGGSSRSAAAAVGSGGTTTTTAPVPSGTGPTTGAPPGGGATPTGQPGEFVRTYQGREYWLYVPSSYDPARPLPLAVFFHGSGDTARNFMAGLRVTGWQAAADGAEVGLLVPDTKSPFRTFPVWSGSPANDIPDMQAELAEVLDLIQADVAPRYALDPNGLHAAGFSDGGLFLEAVGLAEPAFATHTILGHGVGAGYVLPPARTGPVQMACGTQDSFFTLAEGTQAFLRGEGHEVRWEPVSGVGHSMTGLTQAVGADSILGWMQARPLAGGGSPPGGGSGPGSGGSGGGTGTVTRTITTAAQQGLPPVQIDYDVYVPASVDPATPAPVVVAANMGLAPWRSLADAQGLIVIDFRDRDRNGGYDFGYDVLGLGAILTDVDGAWNVDTSRRYYHGFSAGAHWGYAIVLANANTFAGLGINAGSLATARQQGIFPGGVQRALPVAIRHGLNDQVVPVQAGRADRTALQNAGHQVVYEETNAGHTVDGADAAAIWAALRQHRAP